MSKYGSDSVGLFIVDGFNMLGSVTQFEGPSIESVMQETTPFSVQYPEQTPVGMRRAVLTQEGFYNDADDEVHAALRDQEGVSRVVVLSVHPNVAGNKFDGFAGAYGGKYKRVTQKASLHQANAEYTVSGQVDQDGVIVQARATKTADWTSAAVNNGASTPDGAAAYLEVSDLELDGHDGLAVKVRDSADDLTYADLITFTVVTGVNAGERKTVAGTIDQYLKVTGDYTGAGTAPTAKVFVGVKRLVDEEAA